MFVVVVVGVGDRMVVVAAVVVYMAHIQYISYSPHFIFFIYVHLLCTFIIYIYFYFFYIFFSFFYIFLPFFNFFFNFFHLFFTIFICLFFISGHSCNLLLNDTKVVFLTKLTNPVQYTEKLLEIYDDVLTRYIHGEGYHNEVGRMCVYVRECV